MPISKGRAAKTAREGNGKNSEQKPGAMWDKPSLQEFDGRANTNAGSKGKEPGGRWSPAYYETPACVISRLNIRKP